MTIAVIADIVGSRRLADRDASQRELEATIARVHVERPTALAPLTATFADEFQAVFAELDHALAWLLLLQLALPEQIDLRFGIGIGAVGSVSSETGHISDGPGWWSARDAVEAVHRLQDRAVPRARTRVVAAPGEDAAMAERVRSVNAYLLVRDEIVGAMSPRTRRLTYGRCLGRTQHHLAAQEGITQSAVSQALATGGAAGLIAGFQILDGASG